MTMDWPKLLSEKRAKRLVEGTEPSKRMLGDKRDEFEMDFDRVVYSTPFRRLQDKTQVFPLDPNDSVRTRLTHSLEVSHAARGLAKDVCCWMSEQEYINDQQSRQIETIAATCGLLHDLGNPPFGHSGEIAIREWFKKKEKKEEEKGANFFSELYDAPERQNEIGQKEQFVQDFLQFEGNAQTIRLVTKLQILADFHGLNLTCGTLSAACKYVAASDEVNDDPHEKSKVGYFASGNSLIKDLREETGTGNARNPITFLVEAADDCVYNTVDLEDGLTKGILDWKLLKEELLSGKDDKTVIQECLKWAEKRVDRAEVDLNGRAKDVALVQYFRVRAIGTIVTASANAFTDHYDEIIQGDYHGELVKDSTAWPLVKACRKINQERVYCSDETLKLELMGRKVIQDLLDIYWEGAEQGFPAPDLKDSEKLFPRKAYNLMSDNYRKVFEHALNEKDLPERYRRMQLVTDYVCGMTDTFAVNLHKRLTNG